MRINPWAPPLVLLGAACIALLVRELSDPLGAVQMGLNHSAGGVHSGLAASAYQPPAPTCS